MVKEGVLKDHKRFGKRFIPPLIQLDGFQEVSYVNQLLPEILWMGLIIDALDYRKGIELCTKAAKIAHESYSSDKHANFALCSSYSLLKDDERNRVINRLHQENLLESIQQYLVPLIVLYHQFPMAFLGVSKESINKDILIKRIKKSLTRYMNKYETPGLVIQATTIYIRGVTDGLYLTGDVKLPDLNAIIDDPESEPAKRAGAFVRSSVLMEITPIEGRPLVSWSESFWDQGLEIDACKFEEIVDER